MNLECRCHYIIFVKFDWQEVNCIMACITFLENHMGFFFSNARLAGKNKYGHLQSSQVASSLPSWQSIFLSQITSWGMQTPSPQRHSFFPQPDKDI